MDTKSNFEIKNLGNFEEILSKPERKKRGLFLKFFATTSFLVNLTLLFALIVIALGEFQSSPNSLFSNANKPKENVAKNTEVNKEEISTKTSKKEGIVEKNDSYWKIAKRYCGSGRYYLSIQSINNFKALHKGDSVKISCNF
ncbi:MAG: hypothetical protein HYT09_03885 [Candidatus Levybacteria bacterium]|nr:hypothetical protein [Candidatus Levybacteria bacterium]